MTGAGKVYTHENNYIANDPTSRTCTGWFSYEFGSCMAEALRIVPIQSSLLNANLTNQNCQQEFFRDFKNRL